MAHESEISMPDFCFLNNLVYQCVIKYIFQILRLFGQMSN